MWRRRPKDLMERIGSLHDVRRATRLGYLTGVRYSLEYLPGPRVQDGVVIEEEGEGTAVLAVDYQPLEIFSRYKGYLSGRGFELELREGPGGEIDYRGHASARYPHIRDGELQFEERDRRQWAEILEMHMPTLTVLRTTGALRQMLLTLPRSKALPINMEDGFGCTVETGGKSYLIHEARPVCCTRGSS